MRKTQSASSTAEGVMLADARDARERFGQMRGELQDSWTRFHVDPLAREICWRYAVALENVCDTLMRRLHEAPVPKPLLLEICEKGIEAAQFVDDLELRARIQSVLAGRAGQLHLELGNTIRAGELFEFALTLTDQTLNAKLLVRVLTGFADVLLTLGKAEAAHAGFKQAAAVAEAIGDSVGEAFAIFGVGKSFPGRGFERQIHECLVKALDQARRVQRPDLESMVLRKLGDRHIELSQFEAGISCYNGALDIDQKLGNIFTRAQTRTAMGNVYLLQRNFDPALEFFDLARKDAQLIQDRMSEGRAECGLGCVAFARDDMSRAKSHFETARDLARQCHDAEGERQASNYLTMVHRRTHS